MVLKVFAILATILLAWCATKFYQDPRYAIQDSFLLILTCVAGAATLLSWLVVWWLAV